ncbi:MAG: cytochrome c [Chloroflexi bacterium]|nr:cytochrome c [Chloroflexota bacterium]
MIARSRFCLILWLTIVAIAAVACGGAGGQPTSKPTGSPPTHTPFPTFAFVEPTKAPEFEQTGEEPGPSDEAVDDAAVRAITLDPKKVERGLGRYEALACGSCHGAEGEGTDKAGSIQDFAMSEDDFITFVRSGGELGTEHQYSTDRLSDSGSRNLYHYLVSLAQTS